MFPLTGSGNLSWLILGLFLGIIPPAQAQLADTIWEGTQVISGINLQGMRDRLLMDYPVLRGGRTAFPLEIWFWDETHFGMVFRNDRFDPGRDSRKGEYEGWDYNNNEPDYSRSYTYTFQSGKGSFLARNLRIADSPWGWGYAGQMSQYSGRFLVKGNKLTTQKVVLLTDSWELQTGQAYEDPDNPGEYFPNRFDGVRFIGNKYPVFENVVWTKTSRKPSEAKEEPGYITDP